MSSEYLYLSLKANGPVFRIEGRNGRSITLVASDTWCVGDRDEMRLIRREGTALRVSISHRQHKYPPWAAVRHVDLQFFSPLMHCETIDFFAYLHGTIPLDEIFTFK